MKCACDYQFEYGKCYNLKDFCGKCNACQTEMTMPGVFVARYIGDGVGSHLFEIPQYSCLGCGYIKETITVYCQKKFDITKELAELSAM